MKGQGAVFAINGGAGALPSFFCISIYIILCTPHIISILIPLSFPAIPPFAPIFSSETMFFGIKPEKSRRRFLPYSYRFLPLPCCRPKKKSKNFSGRKALCFSALSFSRNFFLKNNCENIWWKWKKSVILHSLNGTSGTPLTTATAKSSLKEIT